MLSRYAENSMNEKRKYGSDELIRAIRIHNLNNKSGTPLNDEPTTNTTREIIQFGGKGVEVVPVEDQKSHTTIFNQDVPDTNEGQPGQPLPLTGQAPINPVYK